MFAAHNNFFDDSKIGEIDKTESLFGARRFVGALDGADDFSKCRKILNKIILSDGLFEGGNENASLVFALFF